MICRTIGSSDSFRCISHLRSHPRTRPLLRQQVAAPRAPTGHQARCLGVLQEKAQPRARVRGLQGEVGRTWGWTGSATQPGEDPG